MKKKFICFISIVVSLLLFFTFPIIWNSCIKETHDANDFLSGNYVDYNGGKLAKQFFDEYANLKKYKDIDFHYCDGDRKITFSFAWTKTMFALDVWYEEEIFFEIIDTILKDTDSTTLYNSNYTCNGFYDSYIITREDDLYIDNYAAFFVDVKHHTIRFFFLYNVPHKPMEVADLRMYTDFTMDIPWNTNEEDWIFDYSDIIDVETSDESTSETSK